MNRVHTKQPWRNPLICTNFIHSICKYGNTCSLVHSKDVQLCKNYFSEVGCSKYIFWKML